MPSAEKSSSAATTLESALLNEPKSVENASNENAQDEKSAQAQNSIQNVLSIISNKVRNLEKRKNKLDGYIKEEESGKELSCEQQKAVSKYEEVVQQLSLSKEFCKQFQKIASDASKEAKREARKTLFARQQLLREVLMIQDLLQRLKVDSVRNDFLNQRNGACPVNKSEMDFIEKFAQHAVPVRPNFSNESSFVSAAKTSAEVFSFLIDERNREFQDTGFTFEKGKALFNRIQTCGYWERDVKFLEVAEESRPSNERPNMGEKSDNMGVETVAAPAPTQVPTPTFNNGNVNNMMSGQQQMQKGRVPLQRATQVSTIPSNASNMKTTVTAVENAYFNQIKYSQQSGGQLIKNNSNNVPVAAKNQNDCGTNFSFLQDSELDSPAGASGSQQQHKMPVNVIQSKHEQQVQQQQQPLPTQQFKNVNFHPQSPIAAGQMYPPGLKVQQLQNSVSHIPVNYQASPQQLNQQNAVPTQVPSHMIPKQQQLSTNGNQIPCYGAQTPPTTHRPIAGAAYPAMLSTAQYQQQSQQLVNAKQVDQKVDGTNDFKAKERDVGREKDKQREEYQEQPQIDTWTNETAAQTAGNENLSTRSSGGGGFNRNNRSAATGAKYNNYRNPQQQSRNNYNENGSGDSPRENSAAPGAPGTFFRNNERYNGSSSNARFENRGGAAGNYKPRDGNHRAGSGRFAGSASAAASQGSSNPIQRK